MSEDPMAAESAETAQGAVETEAPSSAPPWGDDFSAERAWKTILTQRDREKELETDAKAWKRFREDEEFRQQQLRDLGYDIEADEEPDFQAEDDGEPQFVSRQEFEAWQSQQQTATSDRQFAQDLKEFTSDRELSKPGKELIVSRYQRGDFNGPDDLKSALDEWFSYEESLRDEARRSRPKPPTPPTPPGAGRAGEEQFDRRSASVAQRKAQREARIAAAVEATQQ